MEKIILTANEIKQLTETQTEDLEALEADYEARSSLYQSLNPGIYPFKDLPPEYSKLLDSNDAIKAAIFDIIDRLGKRIFAISSGEGEDYTVNDLLLTLRDARTDIYIDLERQLILHTKCFFQHILETGMF